MCLGQPDPRFFWIFLLRNIFEMEKNNVFLDQNGGYKTISGPILALKIWVHILHSFFQQGVLKTDCFGLRLWTYKQQALKYEKNKRLPFFKETYDTFE